MRKFVTLLPLLVLFAACSNNESLEDTGREAGATADKAIERVDDKIAEERDSLETKAENVREKARGVQEDVKEDLEKAGKAVDAAEAELKK